MSGDKQMQKPGDNAQQMQAGTMVVNNFFEGITEQRAREIANEQIQYALEQYSKEAYKKGIERVLRFMERFMEKILRIENALQSFADPSFLNYLSDAQKSAAATDQEEDYDLLAELLACHIQNGKESKKRAAIHYAIKIVGEIASDALLGLTIAHALETITPGTGVCTDGLARIDNQLCKLLYMELPKGNDWLDHLDILRAVRLASSKTSGLFYYYYSKKLNGYACAGIQDDSDEYKKSLDILNKNKINPSIFIPNKCLEGFHRLAIWNKSLFDSPCFLKEETHDCFTKEQIVALKYILAMYRDEPHLKIKVMNGFSSLLSKYDTINQISHWWNSIPCGFSITHVGHVLAHINAKRFDVDLSDSM